jgi:hypothetical protein
MLLLPLLLLLLLLQHPRSGCDVRVTIRWRTAPRFPELPPNSFIHCTGGKIAGKEGIPRLEQPGAIAPALSAW